MTKSPLDTATEEYEEKYAKGWDKNIQVDFRCGYYLALKWAREWCETPMEPVPVHVRELWEAGKMIGHAMNGSHLSANELLEYLEEKVK